jgi:ABC-type phosphate transport system permease subunit
MNQKELSELTDQELLNEAKELKSFSIINALIIGFLIGIIFYSLAKNSWGILTLIPLYFVYKIINDPKNKEYQALEKIIKERNLK